MYFLLYLLLLLELLPGITLLLLFLVQQLEVLRQVVGRYVPECHCLLFLEHTAVAWLPPLTLQLVDNVLQADILLVFAGLEDFCQVDSVDVLTLLLDELDLEFIHQVAVTLLLQLNLLRIPLIHQTHRVKIDVDVGTGT